MDKLKVLSLFSGIGAFEKALTNLKIDYELVGFSEIDKYAIKSYCAIHNINESLNYGDVSKINKKELPDFDLLVGGSPCQAFSVAGRRKGFEDTRGTLFFQYVETLKEKQPKYFVFENVKGLINHDKGNTLNIIAQSFSDVGYRIDMEILNSKYFDVPQNRERVYIVGIREDLIDNEEWNIDSKRNDVLTKGKKRLQNLKIKTFNFAYPKQEIISRRLRDILESNVDEKYYLSEEKTAKLVAQLESQNPSVTDEIKCFNPRNVDTGEQTRMQDHVYDTDGTSVALTAGFSERMNIVEPQVLRPQRTEYGKMIRKQYEAGEIQESRHNMTELQPREDGISNTLTTVQKDNLLVEHKMLGHIDIKGHDALKRVYSPEGISPTLTTMGGGNTEPKITVEQFSSGNGISYCLDANYTKGTAPGDVEKSRRTPVIEEVRPVLTPDRIEKRQNGRRFKDNDEESFTLTAQDRHGVAMGIPPHYRIRKLTPLECFRLQGFDDEDYHRAVAVGISNSQLYKQAGNSITVTVLESIFKELYNTYIN